MIVPHDCGSPLSTDKRQQHEIAMMNFDRVSALWVGRNCDQSVALINYCH